MLYDVCRRLLFLVDGERSHEFALATLRRMPPGLIARLFASECSPSPRRVMGIEFPNPVGLAAGLDKNAECVDAFGALGFGFIEVGTVTPRPQPGNSRPRIFRLASERAIINRLGFNNLGLDVVVNNISRRSYAGVLGVNIGKNFDTPNEQALDDYLACLRGVYPHADYVTVNISSPNTKGLRSLQERDELSGLLAGLLREREALQGRYGRRVPLAVKIAPDLTDEQIQTIARCLLEYGVDGVIATNTTISRREIQGSRHAVETGGLSGAPLYGASNRVVARLHALLGGKVPIIGVGGIFAGEDARNKCEAGAELVQLYTGLIYRGPRLVGECASALREFAGE